MSVEKPKSLASNSSGSTSSSTELFAIDFEIFGKVQGVFFRKCTQKEGKRLGLKGWVMNTDSFTVLGHAEGSKAKLNQFKNWLSKTGSPKSRIDRAEFSEEKSIPRVSRPDFVVRR